MALDPDNIGARMTLLEYHLEAPGIAGGDKGVARLQAAEIARRDPARGAVANLRVATEDGTEAELKAISEKALGLVGTPADSNRTVLNALIGAATVAKDDKMKESLVARLYSTFPQDPAGAHWRLGQVHEKQGRTAEALASYRKALELDLRLEAAAKDLKRLEKRAASRSR